MLQLFYAKHPLLSLPKRELAISLLRCGVGLILDAQDDVILDYVYDQQPLPHLACEHQPSLHSQPSNPLPPKPLQAVSAQGCGLLPRCCCSSINSPPQPPPTCVLTLWAEQLLLGLTESLCFLSFCPFVEIIVLKREFFFIYFFFRVITRGESCPCAVSSFLFSVPI